MNFTQLSKIMPALCQAGVSLELRSSPGRGKSETIREIPEKMSRITGEVWGFASCFAATMSQPDALGFMVPTKDEQGRLISQYTVPLWYQCRDPQTDILNGKFASDYKRGVLLIDEYGQGDTEMKRVLAELQLHGRLGQYALPDGWIVIAASNYSSDRSGVTKELDFVINRRMLIEITDDLESWETWAFAHNVHPVLIAFAKYNTEIVFSKGVPDKQGPWCTPRSLVLVDRVLSEMLDENGDLPTNELATEVACGLIGVGATAQLFATIKLGQSMPSFSAIINDPLGTPVPQAPDAMMLVCYRLAASVTEDNIDAVVKYMDRMPKEFNYVFVKQAVTRMPKLVNTAAMGAWGIRNQALMAALRIN